MMAKCHVLSLGSARQDNHRHTTLRDMQHVLCDVGMMRPSLSVNGDAFFVWRYVHSKVEK